MHLGNFLLIYYGYRKPHMTPQLILQADGDTTFAYVAPRDQRFTLEFDTAQRFCTGWHDLATSESFVCPDNAMLPAQFDHCRHCQTKTGFNPAFYNAASVSPQQTARNAQPHFLYLAHFAPGVVKVGMSWADRGLARLLDQGARSCLILKTYPTATIARQYEAKIAALPQMHETLQVKTKHKLLVQPYDASQGAQELSSLRASLAQDIGITPDDHQPIALDSFYTAAAPIVDPIIVHEPRISGHCLGMIGSTLIMRQNDEQFGLHIGDYTGYRVRISAAQQANVFRPRQMSFL